LDFAHDLFVGIAWKRGTARQKDVQDDSTTPNVTLLVILSLQHLGRDIVGLEDGNRIYGSHDAPKLFLGLEDLGGTEVDHFDVAGQVVILQHEVLGLEIAGSERAWYRWTVRLEWQ
jgi:hypothetical protein